MIWSNYLAFCLELIRGAAAGSANAKQFASDDGPDLGSGAPPVATPCRMLPVRPGC